MAGYERVPRGGSFDVEGKHLGALGLMHVGPPAALSLRARSMLVMRVDALNLKARIVTEPWAGDVAGVEWPQQIMQARARSNHVPPDRGGAIIPTAQSILIARYPKQQHGMAAALLGLGAITNVAAVGALVRCSGGGYAMRGKDGSRRVMQGARRRGVRATA